jgi:hypothetical protein
VLQRTLSDDGFHCEVIAPSLIPSRPGDHRKTDRMDAVHLVRARLFSRIQITRSKNRITGILRVAGHHFTLV